MDPNKLAAAEADAVGWEQANFLAGAADDKRMPRLQFKSFAVPVLTTAVSPECSYRLVRDAIAEARKELLLYIYNLGAEHLVECLKKAVDRGVKMRIMVDTHDTRGGETEAIRDLRKLGVQTLSAPSAGKRRVFTVCHQKFMVIDRKTVVLGSANWASSSMPEIPSPGAFKKGNREWLARIDDAALAQWFGTLFEADWEIPEAPGLAAVAEIPRELLQSVAIPALVKKPSSVFDLESHDGATVTPIVSPDNYFNLLKDALTSATRSIDIQQQYILAGGRVSDLLRIVERRRQAGVEVRIIVSPAFRKVGAKDNWEISRDTLDAFGLVDCLRALSMEYFTHCHNKGVLVDRKIAVVSSTNWSKNSIESAREAGFLIESKSVAEYYSKVFDLDWSELSWAQSDVPNNLMRLVRESLFVPGGFQPLEAAELA